MRKRNHALGKAIIDIDGAIVQTANYFNVFRYLSKETVLKALKTGLERPREKNIYQ